jgi:hypothetical protein
MLPNDETTALIITICRLCGHSATPDSVAVQYGLAKQLIEIFRQSQGASIAPSGNR